MNIHQIDPKDDDLKKERERALARARKKRFDSRMKGETAGVGKHRKAVVVFLDDEARDTLKHNRNQRKLLDRQPVLDSILIEQLLAGYRQNLDSEADRLFQGTECHTSEVKGSELIQKIETQNCEIRELKACLSSSNKKLEKIREKLEEEEFEIRDWYLIEESILAEHQNQRSNIGYITAQEILKKMKGQVDDVNSLRIFYDEFSEYLKYLIARLPE